MSERSALLTVKTCDGNDTDGFLISKVLVWKKDELVRAGSEHVT